jgi:hypothetical protein
MEMPKPQAEHERLRALVGTWTGEETLYPSPWVNETRTATGRFASRLGVDGFYLITDYVEERDGKTVYDGHGVFGWDPGQKRYTMHWFDSMGGSAYSLPALGNWDGDALTFDQKTPWGQSRFVYTFQGDGRYHFKIEMSRDGLAWSKMMEGNYTRR